MKKKNIIGVFILVSTLLVGCQMQIAPEDVSIADELLGKTSDLEIIIPEDEELKIAPEGKYLTVRIGSDIKYEDTVELFTGLSEEMAQQYSNSSVWEIEGVEGWGRVLQLEYMSYLVTGYGDVSMFCGFSKDTEITNVYTSAINSGRLSGTAYNPAFLRERFPETELAELSSKEAIEACNPYIDALGYTYYSVDVYAMDTESLLQLQKEIKVNSPDGDAWEEKDECYLLLYRNQIEGIPIFDIDVESSTEILYSPTSGLLKFDASYIYQEVIAEEEVELIEPARVLPNLAGMAAALGLEGTKLEVTGVQFGYVAKREHQMDYIREGLLTPAYQIVFMLTKADGTQVEGNFVVDAVTGYQLTWN